MRPGAHGGAPAGRGPGKARVAKGGMRKRGKGESPYIFGLELTSIQVQRGGPGELAGRPAAGILWGLLGWGPACASDHLTMK